MIIILLILSSCLHLSTGIENTLSVRDDSVKMKDNINLSKIKFLGINSLNKQLNSLALNDQILFDLLKRKNFQSVTSSKSNNIQNISGVEPYINALGYSNSQNIPNLLSDLLTFSYMQDQTITSEYLLILNQTVKTNCLLIYLAGDNSLDGSLGSYDANQDFVIKDLSECINSSYNLDNLEVIIYLDILASAQLVYKNRNMNLEQGIYLLNKASTSKTSNRMVLDKVLVLNEPNTAVADNLTAFLKISKEMCKANRYILDIWGHGLGVRGTGIDNNPGTDGNQTSILSSEIANSIAKAGIDISVINFSACKMMDMGVIYDFKNSSVKAIAGSAEYIPGNGSFYGNGTSEGILKYLSDLTETTTSQELANNIASNISSINYESYILKQQRNLKERHLKEEQQKNGMSRGRTIDEFLTYSAVSVNNDAYERVKDGFSQLVKPYLLPAFGTDLVKDTKDTILKLLTTDILEATLFYSQNDYASPNKNTFFADFVSFLTAIKNMHTNSDTKTQAIELLKIINKDIILYKKHITGREDVGIGLTIPNIQLQITPDGKEKINYFSFNTNDQSIINNNAFYQKTQWNRVINYIRNQ